LVLGEFAERGETVTDTPEAEQVTALLLGKLGHRDRILDFVTNGTVFMRRLKEFRGIENKAVGDPNEGLHRVLEPSRMWIRVEGTDEPFTALPIIDATTRLDSHFLQHAVYCMFGIVNPPKPWFPTLHAILRHPDMQAFGDTLALITNINEFRDRIHAAAREAGHDLWFDRVRYVERSHEGDMGPFYKYSDFCYQSEWRFVTKNPIEHDRLILRLGDLREIVHVSDTVGVWDDASSTERP
jgi:hypothetical protein